MNQYSKYWKSSYKFLAFVFLLFTMACEDPIDVELSEGESILVVDAWLTTQPTAQKISLSKSQQFLDNAPFEFVEDAQVNLINLSTDESVQFLNSGDGEYTFDNTAMDLKMNIGDSLKLLIESAQESYEATTVVFPTTPIDSFYQETRIDEIFQPDGIYINFLAKDLPGVGNCYWIRSFKNDIFLNNYYEINVSYDGSFDSGVNDSDGVTFIPPIRELVNPQPAPSEGELDVSPFEPGNKARIEIHSISEDGFRFMTILRDQIGNGDNAIFGIPQANPKTNIFHGSTGKQAAGFFNVAEVSTSELIIE